MIVLVFDSTLPFLYVCRQFSLYISYVLKNIQRNNSLIHVEDSIQFWFYFCKKTQLCSYIQLRFIRCWKINSNQHDLHFKFGWNCHCAKPRMHEKCNLWHNKMALFYYTQGITLVKYRLVYFTTSKMSSYFKKSCSVTCTQGPCGEQ